ncbi:hypothetical protein [Lederbergia citrea]|uniref:Uncharacterized protein n=1 Tax=Lederbergia citrea TaxID=2833581 RepID=A0A942Z5E9_9BACI|nr:hypothetical protein [Lederbergia citrea]MBS4179204.1 hypothetical protein [Lederbergia citrea]MBS4205867.1 hypothetical protein [Lederbergia citrea]MBS4224684.1 hypothetical protein [Lederbergia citrea]
MGHDILGYNRAGEEVAYARFSKGNYNSTILYRLLDAYDYFAGVSGSGDSTTFSKQQIGNALDTFNQLYNNDASSHSSCESLPRDQKQILDFIKNCLATAQKEGSVKVFFG